MRDPLEDTAVDARPFLIGLGAAAAGAVVLAVVNPTLAGTVGVLFFFFVVMIGLHELGHFVMAKRAGMKVTEFFIGFGPRLWSVRRGETEYGIKALPLGGYCKIVGMTNLEDIDPADEPRTYRAKGWWARVSTVVAGPVTHFVLAIAFVFVILVGAGDRRLAEHTMVIDEVTESVMRLDADGKQIGEVPSAAYEAGLRGGDRVVAVDGKRVTVWKDMTADFSDRAGDDVVITVERAGKRLDVPLTLMTVYRVGDTISVDDFDGADPASGFAGLSPEIDVPSVGFVEALTLAPLRTYQGGVETVEALGEMFSPSGIASYFDNFTESKSDVAPPDDARFISPVGFGRVANDAVEAGWVNVFALLAAINLFVGILNLLPLLPFDGGHIAVASYEAVASVIRRRKVRVDFARLLPVMVATLSVLGFIFISSLFLDIARPLDANF